MICKNPDECYCDDCIKVPDRKTTRIALVPKKFHEEVVASKDIRIAELEAERAKSERNYIAAVEGRKEFRGAFRKARDEARAATKANEELRAALRAVAVDTVYEGDEIYHDCGTCGGRWWQGDDENHKPGCLASPTTEAQADTE